MDFINPQKRRQNKIKLLLGYSLVAIAVVLMTCILLYQAYGYGFGAHGQIIQNGFVYIDSQPQPAQIYLNGQPDGSSTNTRLQLPSGQYTVKLTRAGYRPWQRAVGVEGGSVEHFDYPFLFPQKLATTAVQQFSASPGLLTQSPNRQWLLIQSPGSDSDFYQYDLSNQKQLAASLTTLSLPDNLLSNAGQPVSWSTVGWANDNAHVLLLASYGSAHEYILFDRQTPADSLNVTQALNLAPDTSLTLNNEKYDQYYEFNSASGDVSTASLSLPQSLRVLSHVLAFQSYNGNTLLYATSDQAPAGQVNIDLMQGSDTLTLRQVAAGTNYELGVASYSGHLYVVAGAASENQLYVYEDPPATNQQAAGQPLVPVDILKVTDPDYVSFSQNAQFIVAEGGSDFAVYDAQNSKGYTYQLHLPVAAGEHATWMDGDRLTLASNGRIVIFDYDDANQQTLQPAAANAIPFFDPKYQWAYTLAPSSSLKTTPLTTGDQFALTSTALLIPADQ